MASQDQDIKNATDTVKGTAQTAKGAYQAVKTAKTAVQAAKAAKTAAQIGAAAGEATNPVGWAMLAYQLKPYLDKVKNVTRKVILVAGGLLLYLLWKALAPIIKIIIFVVKLLAPIIKVLTPIIAPVVKVVAPVVAPYYKFLATKIYYPIAKFYWNNILGPQIKLAAKVLGPVYEAVEPVLGPVAKVVWKVAGPYYKFLATKVYYPIAKFYWNNILNPQIKFAAKVLGPEIKLAAKALGPPAEFYVNKILVPEAKVYAQAAQLYGNKVLIPQIKLYSSIANFYTTKIAIPLTKFYASIGKFWANNIFIPQAKFVAHIVTHPWEVVTKPWSWGKGAFNTVTGGPVEVGGGVLNTGAVIVSGIGSAITGTASAIWGGITSAGGTILSGLSSGLNFVVGGLTSVGLPASAAMIPVVGGIGVITVGNLLVDTITKPAAWFSSEQDAVIGGTGDNEIYTISKTASDGHIENNEIPRDLTYTVKLTAKADLSNISINDKIEVWREGGQGILINRDSDYNLINPLCGGPPELITAGSDWTCQFIIAVNSEVNFKDSVITNTVTVTASQQGSVPVTDTAFSVTTVGKPPVGCPSGWPTDHGVVTNGPKGSDIHKIEYSQGWAAIDIAQPLGTPTKATFSGKAMVVIDDQDGGGFGTHVILEADCNGKRFQAMWTHLKLHSINPNIKVGSIVNAGDIIGEIDDTGLSDGDHIHYAFNGLEMEPPNIPKALGSIDCYGSGACNVSW